MAAGSKSDMTIYHEEYFTGMTEVLEQEANIFNAASAGTIRMVSQNLLGDYGKESFIKAISALVTRRDITSVAAATDSKTTSGEIVTVKCNRKIGPIAMTMDAWSKIGSDPATFYFLLGQQDAKAVLVDYVNTALHALVACFKATTNLLLDVTVGKPAAAAYECSHTNLIRTLAKMGDAGGRIKCWVMHSRNYYDLAINAISDNITNVADLFIVKGSQASLNRPVVVVDSSSLITTGTGSSKSGYDDYFVLGLVEDAARCIQSEERRLAMDTVTGYENIMARYQAETAVNIGVKGHAYATGSGANPTAATLAAAANWSKVVTDDKSCQGVALRCQWSDE